MNAAVRVLTQTRLLTHNIILSLPLPGLRIGVLLLMIFASAMSIVYIKDVNRRLFINSQDLQQANNMLATDYERFLLEKSAWARQDRIQVLAESHLGMEVPSKVNAIVLD